MYSTADEDKWIDHLLSEEHMNPNIYKSIQEYLEKSRNDAK
jgi:hypothetical protein